MPSAMKGEPGLATGLTYSIGGATPFHSCMIVRHRVRLPKLVSSEDRTGARAPSASYCSTEGVAPFPFTHCATRYTAPPVPVHAAPPVPVHTAPPVPVHTAPPVPVHTAPPVPGEIDSLIRFLGSLKVYKFGL